MSTRSKSVLAALYAEKSIHEYISERVNAYISKGINVDSTVLLTLHVSLMEINSKIDTYWASKAATEERHLQLVY